MSRKITPEYLAGWFDACATVTLTKASPVAPELKIVVRTPRKKIIEAAANATRLGTFTRELTDQRGYDYLWTFDDMDEIVKLFLKLRDHVVIYYELVEAVLMYVARQQAYDELLLDARKEHIPNTVARTLQARNIAAAEVIRIVKNG